MVNLAVPNSLRFKVKAVMPFVQMENIALFLEACRKQPFGLQEHDMFLTVDLYEAKDPAQVLQCLAAFSRAANRISPAKFPNAIGGAKPPRSFMSPQNTGTVGRVGGGSYGGRGRGPSTASNASSSTFDPTNRPPSSLSAAKTGDSNSGRWSPTKNGAISPGVSSWSKKSDQGATSPAWNIAQYGYMGGANQGNMGVSYGGRRQITSAGPNVPSLAEKEKKRREKEVEAEVEARRVLEEQEAEEERARLAEEQKWADETKRVREKERQKAEDEKRKWEEEEKRWRSEEEKRQKEEREAEAVLSDERKRMRGNSDARLRGQFLSQYQAEARTSDGGSQSNRIQELERELEKAREREREYEMERQAKIGHKAVENHDMAARMKQEKVRSRSRSRPPQVHKNSDETWREDEREYLRKQWSQQHGSEETHSKSPRLLPQQHTGSRPLPEPSLPPRIAKQHTGSRPLPEPTLPPRLSKQHTGSRPLPTPPAAQNRTDRFLSSNPAPVASKPVPTYSSELGVSEHDTEDRARVSAQTKTRAAGWASKSLLEREMENERERQREWEESQRETKTKSKSEGGVDGIGGGVGGKWDVNQWTGYTGGDGLNKGGQGVGAGRRQIVGPRPPPGGR